MKRSIVIKFSTSNEVECEIGKATHIDVKKRMLSLEEMKDGKFRLLWSKKLIDDFSEVLSLEIKRED